MAVRQRAIFGSEITYVVLDRHWRVVKPIEEYLEYLRQEKYSPNTVRAYAKGLALWWSMLEDRSLDWKRVDVQELARFKQRMLNRGTDPTVVKMRPAKPAAYSTVDLALTSVLSFYRYQAIVADIPAARQFYMHINGGTAQARSQYASFLGHIKGGQNRRVIGRRRDPKSPPPFLTPRQISVIKDDAAQFDPVAVQWVGDLRLRLFWTLLEETGLRLAEALLLQHGDWQPGTGATALIDIQPREDQRRRLRVKNQQYRRIYVSDALDNLYGEYLFSLVDLGLDIADSDSVFVNLFRGEFGNPVWPETIYDWIKGFRRRHPLLPAKWTPHWFRHSHATALLLAGVPEHVVQRRLGHSDIQTLMTTYAHVTEDAAMRAAADWKTLADRWRAVE
ncbi:tyrosine-type recombinase/integrase [Arthrobacter sp. MA-N2]|uniref:tyrosine-type recombinase/integrase n=1 Tax=Arthrobacter sp. MA-N2 TaxID=1101188 RepID=UPI0004879BC7|nr:tyrosine-type recombinase/integrase [Arthrobacter sp. MA-N2]